MISVTGLSKSYGARTLFADVSLELIRGARYGLVGANGSGKSTLLRIVSGQESATDGSISIGKTVRLGTLAQDRFLASDRQVIDLAMEGDEEVSAALSEQKLLTGDADPQRASELDEFIRTRDGYSLRARAGSVLVGLGIPQNQHQRPLGELSGGYRLRVQLAAVLVGKPDALLLDEPTNHLDILSIRWLEKFLAAYPGCLVVISHDRRFLDNVVSHVLDVDYDTVKMYVGNYSSFEQQKLAFREQKEAEIARQQRVVKDKLAFIERFRYKATKARQAQSRIKQVERIEIEELVGSSRRHPRFRFEPLRPSGHDVLEVDQLSHSYGEHQVLSRVSFRVQSGERVAIIGPNGIGKSTLLKILAEVLVPSSGQKTFGHATKVGYFAQDHREHFPDPTATLLSSLWESCPRDPESVVRGHLGAVLFSGDDAKKSIETLSGGEAARMVFARLMVERPNVLLLDEPTNHLDIEAIEALVQSLLDYQGTVIFVSHDRWFVSELATRVIELVPTGYRDYPGTYADYIASCGDDHLDSDVVSLRAREQQRERNNEAAREQKDAISQRDELRKKRNRQKALPPRRDRALERVDELERQLAEIDQRYASPGFFETAGTEEFARLRAAQEALRGELEGAIAEWEELERELAELGRELENATE